MNTLRENDSTTSLAAICDELIGIMWASAESWSTTTKNAEFSAFVFRRSESKPIKTVYYSIVGGGNGFKLPSAFVLENSLC